MPNYQILKNELDNDTEGRGYAAMSHEEAAADMSLLNRPFNRNWMDGSEAYDQTDPAEFTALSDTAKNQWLSLCAIGQVDPFGPAAQVVIDLFPPAGATITNLQTARVGFMSRGTEIGFGPPKAGDIQQARLL